MQYIQVDINFRSIKKLDLPNLSASNNFYGFLILQGFSEKRKQSLKKRIRAGGDGSEPGRPSPGGLPGWLSQTGMLPSDPDRTARGLSSSRDSA
jgi:hypothetical protein